MSISPAFSQRTATSSVGRYVHRCHAPREKFCRCAVRTCTWLTGCWHPDVIPQDARVHSWPTVPPSQVPLGHGWDHIPRSPSRHQCLDKVQRQPAPPPLNNLQQFAPLVAPQHVTVCPEPSFRNAVVCRLPLHSERRRVGLACNNNGKQPARMEDRSSGPWRKVPGTCGSARCRHCRTM